MALIPWRPLSDIENFFENEDWFFPVRRMAEFAGPAMDVYETDEAVIAEINAPGMSADEFDVSVKEGVLRVRGATEEKKEDRGKGYWRKEIRRGAFERAVQLPASVKEDTVDATYAKGILKITMPKAEAKPESRIKVKTDDG